MASSDIGESMDPNNSKPLLVLIPGAWHTASCFDLLAKRLESMGYQTLALTLPSVGAEPPLKSLDPDIAHIRSILLPELEKDRRIVVFMHSYGGVPGSSALYGLSSASRQRQGQPGAVVGLVYLCAWMLPEGQSIRSSGGAKGGAGGARTDEEGRIVYMDPISTFYHDVPKDLAQEQVKILTHHSVATLSEPMRYAAYRDIPTTYLLCENDQAIPYARQVQMVEQAVTNVRRVVCSAGHSPFLSQVEMTAKVISDAASSVSLAE
jgi:pimeloyl-ACP methyl ester carboxylesterase